MTWLAVCDQNERRLSLRGIGIEKQETPVLLDAPDSRLPRGTILIETRMPADGRSQVVFGFNRAKPVHRSLTVQILPTGGIALMQVQDDAIFHIPLEPITAIRVDVLRITYSWDETQNWAELTLEVPGSAHMVQATASDPLPLTVRDVRDLCLGRVGAAFSKDVIFAALSDQVEPIGPMPGLLPCAKIITPWGEKPVRDFRRGDTVLSRDTEVVPVLGKVTRTVPAHGSFRPIRLRAPYFGLRHDVLVSSHQRLVLDGPEVEYLFGREAALVPAHYLLNTHAAIEEPCGPTVSYSQLLLPKHETVFASGTELESLFIGRIRRDRPVLARSLCAKMERATLPEHGQPRFPVLKWHEAIHLARRRAA